MNGRDHEINRETCNGIERHAMVEIMRLTERHE